MIQIRSCGSWEKEKSHTQLYAPHFFTHQQGCVTGSKIRPLAPECLLLFYGGSRASSITPFRQQPTVFPSPRSLGLQPDTDPDGARSL